MRIVCPQCGYSRDIPAGKIPPRSSVATCPKCRFRFRFREDSAPAPRPALTLTDEPAYPPKPSRPQPAAVHEDLRPTPPPYVPQPRTPRPAQPLAPFTPLDDDPEELANRAPRTLKPQARWLPDPEPGEEAARERAHSPWPEPPARSWVKPPRVQPPRDETVSDPAQDHGGFAMDAPHVRDDVLPGDPVQPDRTRHIEHSSFQGDEDEFSHGDFHTPDGHVPNGDTPQRRAPEGDSEAVFEALRDQAPRPDHAHTGSDSRTAALGRDASGASLSELGEALRGQAHAPAAPTPPRPAEPEKPRDPDFWDSAQAASRALGQATAGDEPVRDIWARLQAMGGEPAPAGEPGRPAKSPQDAAHAAELAAPWDELEHVGVVPAFLKTVQNVLFKPGDCFETLAPDAGRIRPLLFAVVVSELVVGFWMLWKFFGMGPNFAELTRTEGFQGLGAGGMGSLALLGLAPVSMVAFSYLDAGLTHFLLGLLRGVTKPFEGTYRLLCYAGAPWLLAAAPIPLQYLLPVVVIWHMALQAVGLKKMHQSGYAQVLAAVLVKWSFYLMAFFAVWVLAMRR